MSPADRGALFVRQEELENIIQQHMRELAASGKIMTDFGRRLGNNPQQITFSNAPGGLGSIPMELLSSASLEWRGLSQSLELEPIAQKIQDLRTAEQELRNVQDQLKRG